jgi:hypothetical protein
MTHAASAQRICVPTKDGDRVLAVHSSSYLKADRVTAIFTYVSPNGCRSRTKLLSRSSSTWV